jgi:hypothetical protein
MPSAPGYKRDYKEETKTSNARGEKPKRAERNRARRIEMNLGMVKKGDGKDVDHIKQVEYGGTNAKSNLRVEPAGKNRSFPRNPNGSIKK